MKKALIILRNQYMLESTIALFKKTVDDWQVDRCLASEVKTKSVAEVNVYDCIIVDYFPGARADFKETFAGWKVIEHLLKVRFPNKLFLAVCPNGDKINLDDEANEFFKGRVHSIKEVFFKEVPIILNPDNNAFAK
jgi:hypothetical protein